MTHAADPTPRTAPELPAAVTGSLVYASQRFESSLRNAVAEALLTDGPSTTLRGYWLLESIGPTASWAQRELCDALNMDRSDMVRLLDSLENDGLVERIQDRVDRRRRLVRLTDAGERLRRTIRERIARAEEQVLAESDDVVANALRRATAALDDPNRLAQWRDRARKRIALRGRRR